MKDYKEVVKSWLEGNFDAETKAAVKKLQETDPVGLEDAFYRNLEFGTGGLRGIMGVGTNRMNKYTVGMATQGLANYIKEHVPGAASVCIAHDSRNNSRLFAEISADVLSNNGIHVFLFEDLRPTPELSYSIRVKGATAGIMVTASHNPKEYNGYKVFWSDGGQITAPVDKDIVAEVAKIEDPADVRFAPVPGITPGGIEMMGAEVDECYLRDITSLMLSPEAVAKHADLKIVYTPLHGCGVRLMPAALQRIGFKNIIHVPEQDVSDGNFPTVASPNPEEPAAMKMALEKADETGADLVLATDPDADRLGIAVRDDAGKMVQLTGNQTWSFLTYYLLNRWQELGKLDGKQYCVKTIVTSELLTAICEHYGVPCYNVLTGFKYIAEIVKEKEGKAQFICGGEESLRRRGKLRLQPRRVRARQVRAGRRLRRRRVRRLGRRAGHDPVAAPPEGVQGIRPVRGEDGLYRPQGQVRRRGNPAHHGRLPRLPAEGNRRQPARQGHRLQQARGDRTPEVQRPPVLQRSRRRGLRPPVRHRTQDQVLFRRTRRRRPRQD